MAADRTKLAASQEVFVRIIADALIEDIVEEGSSTRVVDDESRPAGRLGTHRRRCTPMTRSACGEQKGAA